MENCVSTYKMYKYTYHMMYELSFRHLFKNSNLEDNMYTYTCAPSFIIFKIGNPLIP